MNYELPDVEAGFRKGRGTKDQIANIHWINEKAREFWKNIYFCFITSDMQMTESEEELQSLSMKVKEESENVVLKLSIQKTKIIASGPITSWQIHGETVEIVRDFISLGSKITADGDCSHEIKRWLLLERKAMTNLDCILKSRDIILPTKRSVLSRLWFFQ